MQRKKTDDRQLTIFEFLNHAKCHNVAASTAGTYKIYDRLQASIRDAIKSCQLSRHQIAGEMSHLLDESITKEMIDSWTRESDEINGRPCRHIPAEYLPAFCRAVSDNRPVAILGEMVGMFCLPGPDALRSEIRKLEEEAARVREEKRRREVLLKEMEGKR